VAQGLLARGIVSEVDRKSNSLILPIGKQGAANDDWKSAADPGYVVLLDSDPEPSSGKQIQDCALIPDVVLERSYVIPLKFTIAEFLPRVSYQLQVRVVGITDPAIPMPDSDGEKIAFEDRSESARIVER
jgi:hypothetical protein